MATARFLFLLVGVTLLVSGCGGNDDGPPGSQPGPAAAAPTITQQPADASVTVPATATFNAAASGEPEPTVRWQLSSDAGTTWNDIPGATATAYTTPATTAGDDGARFRALFTNASGSATSNAATLTVSAGNVVGPAGGTLVFLGGAVRLTFPPGAVAAPTTIDVQATSFAAPRFPAPVAGTSYAFAPDGIVFSQPVTLTLRYDDAQLPPATDVQTMRVGKSSADGWTSFASTVDAAARTVSADIGGFSSYGVIPGVETLPLGQIAGMELRAYDWPDVTSATVATDPSGAVYVAGFKPGGSGSTVPVASGAFVARLNVDLSVQWLRPLPNSDGANGGVILRVDQEGNAWAAYNIGPTYQIGLVGFNPNGTTRSGFPISFASGGPGTFDQVRGMAVDVPGNIHLFGRRGGGNIEQGTYTVVRGADGTFARPITPFSLPGGTQTTSVTAWDLALDGGGNVYFTSTWFGNGNPAFGGHVSSFAATTMQARAGWPIAQPTLTFLFGRSAVSKVANPLTILPVTSASGLLQRLLAFDPLGGVVQPGWPVTFGPEVLALEWPAVDLSANVWQIGQVRPSGPNAKMWLASLTSSGQMRAGFPRVFGGNPSDLDLPYDIALDPAGTAYVVERQTRNPGPSETRRIAIVRQPAL
jgi:hypothetical protein